MSKELVAAFTDNTARRDKFVLNRLVGDVIYRLSGSNGSAGFLAMMTRI